MRKKGVDQGAVRVSGARMNDQAGRLVQDEQVVVLEENVECDRFRLGVDLFDLGFAEFNDVAGPNLIARFGGLAIQFNEPRFDQRLKTRARKGGKGPGQVPVEALPRILGSHDKLDLGWTGHGVLQCAPMPEVEPETAGQACPACGLVLDVSQEDPLSRVACPGCGEKFRVARAFDHFELMETLGVGGMGSVYKARDTRLNRFVALKLLRPELSADPAEIERLEQEARATAAVNDPNVVQVFSSGTDHGQFYLVMELVDQGSLDDRMAEQGRVGEAAVLDAGIRVARGLRAACEKGLIHRDVKPGNILFADEQVAKIGDFGLAVAAGQSGGAQNEIWGTPYYVAPERLNNEPEDFRSDMYSLGATLYHAMAGRPPFEGETNSATELRELKSRPLSLGAAVTGLRRETVRVTDRMVAPDPGDRFESYDAAIAALEEARDALNPSGKKARRRRLAIIAGLLLVLIGAAATYFGNYYYRRIHAEKAAGAKAAELSSEETLRHLYDDARRELIAGKYDSARNTFTRLAGEAQNRQPLLNWIRLHRGLANLLRGYTTQARQAFQELESAGPFSAKPEDAVAANFFVSTARTMNSAESVPARPPRAAAGETPETFAVFLFAIKDWQQSDFANAAGLLEEFSKTEARGAYGWVNDYKPLAERFLADYRVYADWKKQAAGFTGREQVTAALTALRTAQGNLQLKGKLNDAFKDEETKLLRQMEEK